MMTEKRMQIGGDYLIIAPKEDGNGYRHSLTERAFLVDSLIAFLKRFPKIMPHQITIYELKQVNEKWE